MILGGCNSYLLNIFPKILKLNYTIQPLGGSNKTGINVMIFISLFEEYCLYYDDKMFKHDFFTMAENKF